jgi:hypothetical protein
MMGVYIAVVGNISATYTTVDEDNNRASFTLTTMVVDTQAPVLEYASKYNQIDISATHVMETVEASRQDSYEFGMLSAMDLPLMETLSTLPHGLKTSVDRGRRHVEHCKEWLSGCAGYSSLRPSEQHV